MEQLLSKQLRVFLLILISFLISFACLPGSVPTGDPTSEALAPAEAVTAQADMVFGPGVFKLLDTTVGLASLPSYKATLTVSFDGTRDGQSSQWSKTYVMLTSIEPATRQLTIEKTGDISDFDTVSMIELNGAAYERRGENACIATVIDPENSLSVTWEPVGFLNGVIGAEQEGSETVNDVASDKYIFDERAFGQTDIAQSTGGIWVASDGGYIVKYFLTTTAGADYFGEGIEGTLTWDYDLTDINQPVTITVPDDCPAGLVDVPLLTDASNILNIPSVMQYDTASSLADASAFYQAQLPSLGWILTGEPAITETTAMMEFTQGAQNLTVIAMADAGVTTVHILLQKSNQ